METLTGCNFTHVFCRIYIVYTLLNTTEHREELLLIIVDSGHWINNLKRYSFIRARLPLLNLGCQDFYILTDGPKDNPIIIVVFKVFKSKHYIHFYII